MPRTRIILLAAALAFLCLSAVALLAVSGSTVVEPHVVATGSIDAVSFDSRSPDPQRAAPKQFNETHTATSRDIDISFRIKAYTLGEQPNVFQTAPMDEGMRLELSKPSTLSLLVGHRSPERVKSFVLTDSFENNRWYTIRIIGSGKHLQVILDESLRIDTEDPLIDYAISSIAVGTGYAMSRPFDGIVSDFTMKYRLLTEHARRDGLLRVAPVVAWSTGALCLAALAWTLLPWSRLYGRLSGMPLRWWLGWLVALVLVVVGLGFPTVPLLNALRGIVALLLLGSLAILLSYHHQKLTDYVLSSLRTASAGLRGTANRTYRARNLRFVFFLLVLVSVLSLPVSVYVQKREFLLTSEGSLSGISYDSRSKDADLATPKAFQEPNDTKYKRVDITFEMKAHEMSRWANVFQTAPANLGMRLELSGPSVLALVVRHKGPDGIRSIVLSDTISRDRWYRVRIVSDPERRILVYLDNVPVADIRDPLVRYDISDIVVGAGYGTWRLFDGAVRNFTMKYSLYERQHSIGAFVEGLHVFAILGFCGAAALLLLLVGQSYRIAPLGRAFFQAGSRSVRRISLPALGCALAATAMGILLVSFAEKRLTPPALAERSITGVSFDSRASGFPAAEVREFVEHERSDSKNLDISFDMKAYRITQWANVFQTAPMNEGIRLELSRPSGLTLVMGHKGGAVKGATLTEALKVGQWYHLRIVSDREKRIIVYLDGVVVADISDPTVQYDISAIAVGTGYSKSRPFDGAVRNFSMKYSLFGKARWRALTTIGAPVLLLLFLVLAVIFAAGLVTKLAYSLYPRGAWPFRYLLLACMVAILLLVISVPISREQFDSLKEHQVTADAYDSRSSDPATAAYREFVEPAAADGAELDVSLRMKAYTMDERSKVFQTAPAKEGVWLELTKPRNALLLVGQGPTHPPLLLELTRSMRLNQWYTLRLILRNGSLTAYLDGIQVVGVPLPATEVKVSRIVVGTGYSASHAFDGALQHVSIRYTLLRERTAVRLLVTVLRVIGVLSLLACALLLLARWAPSRDLPRPVLRARTLYTVLLAGFAAQALFFLFRHYGQHLLYPFTSPLFIAADRFMDFFNINLRGVSPERYTELTSICPPFGLLVARYFASFADYTNGPFFARDQWAASVSVILYTSLVACVVLAIARDAASAPGREGQTNTRTRIDAQLLAIALLLSYPFLYAADRGNYVMASMVFLYLYVRNSDRTGWSAAMALAMCISFKAHLLVYLVAFLDRSHLDKLIKIVASLLFVNVASSIILQDFGFFTSVLGSYAGFSNAFTYLGEKVFNSSSLNSVLYGALTLFSGPGSIPFAETVYSFASMIAMVLLSLTVLLRVRDLTLRLFYLTILLIILPIASFDYNLILLFAFIPFLTRAAERTFSRAELVLLAFCLIPKHYITLGLVQYYTQFGHTFLRLTEQIIINPLLLASLVAIGLGRADLRFKTSTTPDVARAPANAAAPLRVTTP